MISEPLQDASGCLHGVAIEQHGVEAIRLREGYGVGEVRMPDVREWAKEYEEPTARRYTPRCGNHETRKEITEGADRIGHERCRQDLPPCLAVASAP